MPTAVLHRPSCIKCRRAKRRAARPVLASAGTSSRSTELGLAGREVLSWSELRSARGLAEELAALPALRTAVPWPLACWGTLCALTQLLFLGWPQRGKGSGSRWPGSPSSTKRTSPEQAGTTAAA